MGEQKKNSPGQKNSIDNQNKRALSLNLVEKS
jgi:hypothetical protein